jgi:hypothetical protein
LPTRNVERLPSQLSAGTVGAAHGTTRVPNRHEAEQPAERYKRSGDAHSNVERVNCGRLHGGRDVRSGASGVDTCERLPASLRNGGSRG